jgi:hypothetical protein
VSPAERGTSQCLAEPVHKLLVQGQLLQAAAAGLANVLQEFLGLDELPIHLDQLLVANGLEVINLQDKAWLWAGIGYGTPSLPGCTNSVHPQPLRPNSWVCSCCGKSPASRTR